MVRLQHIGSDNGQITAHRIRQQSDYSTQDQNCFRMTINFPFVCSKSKQLIVLKSFKRTIHDLFNIVCLLSSASDLTPCWSCVSGFFFQYLRTGAKGSQNWKNQRQNKKFGGGGLFQLIIHIDFKKFRVGKFFSQGWENFKEIRIRPPPPPPPSQKKNSVQCQLCPCLMT